MSDHNELAGKGTSDAEAIRIRAAEWLVTKRTASAWADNDQELLNKWLCESDENLLAYWRLEAGWERAQRLAALRAPVPSRPARWRFLRAVAALICLGAVTGGVWSYLAQPKRVAYATSIGGHESVVLADGSRIELNTDTKIQLLDVARARTVWLEKGEAYFQVAHDPERPLTVFVDNRRVTDIGTKFVIRREPDAIQISVLEGRVSFGAGDTSQELKPLLLSQGDTVLASVTGLAILHKSATRLSNEMGWRRGVIVFDNATLAAAAKEVSRYTAVKITIADDRLSRMSVSGTVSAGDPLEFLQMARSVFGLHTEKRSGEFVISR